jgi:hypothetical protein
MRTVLDRAGFRPPPLPRALARISIVIPVYRGERTIGPLVDALHAELGNRY